MDGLEMAMLEILKDKTLTTATGLIVAAAGMGFSPLEPESFALAIGSMVIKRVRNYVRRGPFVDIETTVKQ
jgi:hypothetical protein